MEKRNDTCLISEDRSDLKEEQKADLQYLMSNFCSGCLQKGAKAGLQVVMIPNPLPKSDGEPVLVTSHFEFYRYDDSYGEAEPKKSC